MICTKFHQKNKTRKNYNLDSLHFAILFIYLLTCLTKSRKIRQPT